MDKFFKPEKPYINATDRSIWRHVSDKNKANTDVSSATHKCS